MTPNGNRKLQYDKLFADYCRKYPNENELTKLVKFIMPWMVESIEKLEAMEAKQAAIVEQKTEVKELPPEPVQEEWLTAVELSIKYKFINHNSVYPFITYAPEDQKYYKLGPGQVNLFNPKELIIYISQNRIKYPKFNSRLAKENYYGFLGAPA